MLVLVCMLFVALLPTGNTAWQAQGILAICYFTGINKSDNPIEGEVVLATMIVSVLVLFSAFLTGSIKLSGWASQHARAWTRGKPSAVLRSFIKKLDGRADESRVKFLWMILSLSLETFYVLLKACFEAYESTLGEV